MGEHLDALLGLAESSDVTTDESEGPVRASTERPDLLMLAPEAIRPNEFQPREDFDEADLDGLAASIVEVGLLQPIIVRRIDDDRYELIAGERRWRAAQRAGLPEIPALLREADDRSSLEQAIVENLHRDDLNSVEEAVAYRQLMEDFGLTQDVVARRVGRSRSAVANTLRLLQLPAEVLRLVRRGELSAGHARALLTISDPAVQWSLAVKVVADRLSVREVEELVRAGSGPKKVDSPRSKRRDGKPSAMLEIEQLLSDQLETRVSVSMARNGGRLVVEFADLEDLDRIYRELSTSTLPEDLRR